MIRKKFDWNFKSRVAQEAIKGNKTIADLSSECTQIAAWEQQALEERL